MQKELETQIRADKKGCTPRLAETTVAHADSVAVEVPSACIPSYLRESAFPLS
jgi:hypothetical protein